MFDNSSILSLARRWKGSSYCVPLIPAERVYAIGDIHGRFDLFGILTRLIANDHERRPSIPSRIIVLGDIIDRGPDAAKMVKGCMRLTSASDRFTVLKGNHEEMMVDALRGNLYVYEKWLAFGGKETLLSFGVPKETLEGPATMHNLRIAANTVGSDTIRWMARLPLYYQHGNYLYVHAGIRPGIPLRNQHADDLLWINEEFLEDETYHGFTVIHGHTIDENGPDIRSNRIGIDTGAYRTNNLTALGIENGRTWTLSTRPQNFSCACRPDPFSQAIERQDSITVGRRV